MFAKLETAHIIRHVFRQPNTKTQAKTTPNVFQAAIFTQDLFGDFLQIFASGFHAFADEFAAAFQG